MIGRALLAGVVAAAGSICGGCLQRRIHVTSDPPGATVWLNGVEVGRTPVAAEFTFYGTYDVRLHKDGHEPVAASKWAVMPWYEIPPVDFVAMALPWTVSTNVRWDFDLAPSPDLAAPGAEGARADLLERADDLRARSGARAAAQPGDQQPVSGGSSEDPE